MENEVNNQVAQEQGNMQNLNNQNIGQVPNQPESNQNYKNKKGKKNIIIIICAVVLVAIAIVAVIMLKPEDKKKTTDDKNKTKETKNVDAVVDDDTKDDEDNIIDDNTNNASNEISEETFTDKSSVRSKMPKYFIDAAGALDYVLAYNYYDKDECKKQHNGEECKEIDVLNKNKTYFSTTEDRIDFTNIYISFHLDSISSAKSTGFGPTYNISKPEFNKYYKKLFGEIPTEYNTKYEMVEDIGNNTLQCIAPDGLGYASWIYMFPSEPTNHNGVYTLPIDLVKDSAVYDYENEKIKSYTYKKSDVLATAYLKYKKLSDGSYNIISLSFNK